jgi:hypothetical protein
MNILTKGFFYKAYIGYVAETAMRGGTAPEWSRIQTFPFPSALQKTAETALFGFLHFSSSRPAARQLPGGAR